MTDGENELPDQPEDKVMVESDLETQAAELAAERDSYFDQLQRSMAEFANYRRRVEQERSQSRASATKDLLSQILPIADDMQRGLANLPESEVEQPWAQGMILIGRKLESFLEREGVTRIDALGQPFDPALHEAVAIDPGSSDNVVVEVYQNGYQHGSQLLRPAMVRVGNSPVA